MGPSRPWVLIGYLLWLAASCFMGFAFGDLMLSAAQFHRVTTTPVLLAPCLVTSLAVAIQTGRRAEANDRVPTCSCL